jgi:hypothetical protein
MITPNQRLVGIVVVVAILLLIPFLAMRFTGEVNWTPIDFYYRRRPAAGNRTAVRACLRMVKKFTYRLALCAAILFALALIWIELAVGLFGTRFAGS